ncbi:hypothetical protein O181_029039 [Austropuccinia psidii MF-1]|uniref:Uncharacterized protein n=1 Tax=Austropuccinia psidii MF-1 TaxID=1389203 RepID=A0A9Q3H469_9BASI|nr:hypothetical protein [Austropuccinia psidii MF-1]
MDQFWGPIATGGRSIYSISEVPFSRFNNQFFVETIRQTSDSPTDPDAEGSDELDGKEVEVLNPLAGHSSSSSRTQTPAKKGHSQVIPSAPRNFQPILSTVSA